jgi:Cyclin, N-terminal domain
MQDVSMFYIQSPSTKSILSSEASLNIKFECEENLEMLGFPSRSYFEKQDDRHSFLKKNSSSFMSDSNQFANSDYEPLEIEEDDYTPLTAWRPIQLDYLNALTERELEYMPNPYALESVQNEVTAHMRTILFDWIIEVSSEFSLKRETCYLALSYIDRVLSSVLKVKKTEFQLLGITCMHIASKIEEIYPPKLEDWVRSADGGYASQEIIQKEKLVLRTLGFKVFPATVYNWTNWLMTQWDSFVDFHFGCVSYNRARDFAFLPSSEKEMHQKLYEKRLILFKEANQKAYKRFRETMQILDISILNVNINKFLPRVLAGGLLYLMISKYFYETNYCLLYFNGPDYVETLKNHKNDNLNLWFGDEKEFVDEFEEINDNQHIEGATVVQELYSGFLAASLEIKNIEEIYQTVSFFHPYLELDIIYDLPTICRTQNKARIESHYEEFLTYQTHNSHNLQFISR